MLDIIVSEDDIIYVMDILFFNDMNYSNSEAETRFFTIFCKVPILAIEQSHVIV